MERQTRLAGQDRLRQTRDGSAGSSFVNTNSRGVRAQRRHILPRWHAAVGGGRPLDDGREQSWHVLLAKCPTIFSNDDRIRDLGVDAGRFWRCMSEAFLQRQLTHPPFPHARRVGMAQCMWCDPRFPDTKPLAMSFKQLDQGMIAERLKASLALTSH